MSNTKYYIDIEYKYEKCGTHKSRFKEPFSSKRKAIKTAYNLARGVIDDINKISCNNRKIHITYGDNLIEVACFITNKDNATVSIPSIISYTVVQDN